MKTKKEIEEQIGFQRHLILTCVTEQMVREIQIATLKWVMGDRKSFTMNFILEDGAD